MSGSVSKRRMRGSATEADLGAAPKPIAENARKEIIPAHILEVSFIMALFLAKNKKRVKKKVNYFFKKSQLNFTNVLSK
jgi:hypothetical protein